MKTFDFAVIGGGSGGYAAARTAAAAGMSVVIIDSAEVLGGLCILRGCMPSKTLIESANRQLVINRAAEFGLQAETGRPDIAAIRARKRLLIEDFASYRQGQLASSRFTLLRGRARFASGHRLQVTDAAGQVEELEFRFACIATGSVVSAPPVPGLAATGYWTSDEILDADQLAQRWVVLGGGVIALEMAHYLAAMGRDVHIIQRSAGVLSMLDPECGATVLAAYRQRGIQVTCDTQLETVTADATGKAVCFRQQGDSQRVECDEILVATGRRANTTGLNLESVGIVIEGGKVKVNAAMQTSLPHVFAAGDVCSALDVVHIAIQQGEIGAKNAIRLAAGHEPNHAMDYRLKLLGIFSQPQVASVGLSEQESKELGIDCIAASYPFNDHGKSMVMGEMDGFVKLIAEKSTGKLIGASVVGPEATELIHEITVAMAFHSTARQLVDIPHYHPTLSEIWTYPAEEIADELGL
jgi:pyruvate/2-oxoglutarate dehydrogenase complex dihydrolipoamide dehydrogenase (E3) component